MGKGNFLVSDVTDTVYVFDGVKNSNRLMAICDWSGTCFVVKIQLARVMHQVVFFDNVPYNTTLLCMRMEMA